MAYEPPIKKIKLDSAAAATAAVPCMKPLSLLACGSNLAGQLWISDLDHGRFSNLQDNSFGELPNMLYQSLETPTTIMTAESTLKVLYTDRYTLLVERDGCLYIRGYAPRIHSNSSLQWYGINGQCEKQINLPGSYLLGNIKKAFGNRFSLAGLLMHDGTILNFNVAVWKFEKLESVQLNKVKDLDYSLIGELCVLSYDGKTIDIYDSISSMRNDSFASSLTSFGTESLQCLRHSFIAPFDEHQKVQFNAVHACASTFAAVTVDGTIYTCGDMRYNSLGRKAEPSSSLWDIVTALEGITITKLACNPDTWMQVALAEDGSVYLWGGTGREKIQGLPDPTIFDEVGLVTLPDDIEAQDIFVGINHVGIVERSGKGLWVSGSSHSGELGFAFETKKSIVVDHRHTLQGEEACAIWRKWKDEDGIREVIMQATSGAGNTLVVISRN